MLRIGCHLSASGGYLAMGKEALAINANTFQFFTRNPRGGRAKALDLDDIAAYLALAADHDIRSIMAHAPYTLNACAAREDLRVFARDVFADDLTRLEHIPGSMYNFHPGCHVGQGTERGIELVAELLDQVLDSQQHTTVLLETMAGKGSELGGNFAELRAIIDRVQLPERLGVCMDTCHVWDGGYNVADSLERVLDEFEHELGMKRLRAIHINDSLNVLGARKDRHAKIGQGKIGINAFEHIINHPALKDLPFYLETPNDLAGYADEIALLRSIYTA